MEDKLVSILKIIGGAAAVILASWLLRGVIGLLTALLLFVLSVFPAFIDLFIGIVTLGDSAGAWSAYIDWITSMDLSNAWIFWDVLIFAPLLFIYISCCIESGSLLFGPSKSQPEHIKTIYTLSGNAPEDKWMRRHREKQAKRAKKAAKQNGVTNSTRNNRYYVDKKNNWLTNTPTRWQSNK